MNRLERRAAASHLRKENEKQPDRLEIVPVEKWPRKEPGLIALWRSKKFLVQIYSSSDAKPLRLSVCKTAINQQGEWQGDITWEELQEIKSQCGYGHLDAVEIYPKEKDVVNVANMRHLWVLSGSIEFAWRA